MLPKEIEVLKYVLALYEEWIENQDEDKWADSDKVPYGYICFDMVNYHIIKKSKNKFNYGIIEHPNNNFNVKKVYNTILNKYPNIKKWIIKVGKKYDNNYELQHSWCKTDNNIFRPFTMEERIEEIKKVLRRIK